MSRRDCPYLIAPRAGTRGVELPKLGQGLHGRAGTERAEPRVEVALHPVLEDDRALLVRALALRGARADRESQIVARLVRIDHARDDHRIDDDRALALEDLDRVGHRGGLRFVEPAPRRRLPGRRHLVVEERARDADARALEPVTLEVRGVVTVTPAPGTFAWPDRTDPARRSPARPAGSRHRSPCAPSAPPCPGRRRSG